MLTAFDGRPIIEIAPAPEFFIERCVLVEPVMGGNVRSYFCVERDGHWVLSYTNVIPAPFARANLIFARKRLETMFNRNVVVLRDH